MQAAVITATHMVNHSSALLSASSPHPLCCHSAKHVASPPASVTPLWLYRLRFGYSFLSGAKSRTAGNRMPATPSIAVRLCTSSACWNLHAPKQTGSTHHQACKVCELPCNFACQAQSTRNTSLAWLSTHFTAAVRKNCQTNFQSVAAHQRSVFGSEPRPSGSKPKSPGMLPSR